jgi:hypothetical protein
MKNTSINELSKSLESLYLKKKYDETLKSLRQNADKYSTGQLYYNLGTIYAKKNEFAVGRYYLEKSMRNGYVYPHVIHNLDFIKSQIKVFDIDSSPHYIDKSINSFLLLPGDLYLTFSLLLFLAIILLRRFNKTKNKMFFFFLLLLSLSPLLFKKMYYDKIQYALNFKELVVFEGPSKIYDEIGILKAGTKFIVGEKNGNWYYIKYPIELSGWVLGNFLGIY